MKAHRPFPAAPELLGVILSLAVACSVQANSEMSLEWPRVFVRDGLTNIIYQPQLESWDYATLEAVAAVSVQPRGEDQATFGTLQFTAKTRIDRASRTVFLEQPRITEASFPSAGVQEGNYVSKLRSFLPREMKTLPLDHLEANLAICQARHLSASQPLKNDPPAIIFSTKPAMIVPVDGPPVYRALEGIALERVLNTRALILRDKSGKHFLHLFDGYLQAPALGGPWTPATKLPKDIKKAENQAVKAKQVDLMAGQENPENKQKPSLKTTPIPKLYVTSLPTELIVVQGEPRWMPVPRTLLLYLTNTLSHVFKALSDQKTYVLLSGRWFRAPSFDGPWEFVPAANLPKDFLAIPDDSPQENVKASIPGTRQAEEAVIANSIPSTVKVDRSKAKMDPPPEYEGSPKLAEISGTPLQYVVNSPIPVIKVDASSWYACQNGVWFTAPAATGPWAVATSVPAVVYAIPPSCPVHYVVYSRVYFSDASFVWIGTTPGYYGAVISPDGTVVYGTGYVYPAYVGTTLYVCYPVTYGYAANPCWTPWAGWAFGFAVGWAMASDYYWWCGCPPAPYWGPYWYPCYGAYYNAYGGITAWGPYGWAGTTGYIYHQNGPWTGVSRGAAGYNAWTGNAWATSYGRAYNSTTGTRAVGQRGAVENVYTGNYAYGGRGAFYNEQTGAAGIGRKITVGNEETGKQGTAGRATVYNPKTDQVVHIGGAKGEDGGIANINGHVIAGKDGNYYRPDGQGGWEEIPKPLKSGGATPSRASDIRPNVPTAIPNQTQWSKVQPSGGNQERVQQLNQQFNARMAGAQRQQSYQMNRPSFSGPAMGGGARRR